MTDDPRSRGRAADEGNWMTVPGGIDHRRADGDQPRIAVFIFWFFAVLLFGFVEWLIFCVTAINGNGCPSGGGLDFGPLRKGGAASGGALLTATVIGLSLWLAAGFLALWLRGGLAFVMFGFVAVYGVSLLALWPIASLIWGPRRCS